MGTRKPSTGTFICLLRPYEPYGKLKLLLVGSVLTDNGKPTLLLEDFISGGKIANKPSPCPLNNVGLVTALKNVQMVLQVCFSDFLGHLWTISSISWKEFIGP